MAHARHAFFAVFRDLFIPRWPDTIVGEVRAASNVGRSELPVTHRQVVSSETKDQRDFRKLDR